MSRKILNQKGFTAIEAILILVIIAVIGGTGYYVYHANKKTNDTLDAAGKSSQSSPAQRKTTTSKGSTSSAKTTSPATSQNYVTIKEWGVRAPYSGAYHLTYSIKNDGGDEQFATFTSAELASADSQCASFGGGGISRLTAADTTTEANGSDVSVAQAARDNPALYQRVGAYYYTFVHDNGACSEQQSTGSLQSQTNDAVKALVSKLEVIPGS